MKRLIVYDLDGTLVDTLGDIAEAANHMLRTLRLPPCEPKVIRRFIGSGVHELVTRCLKTTDPERIEQGVTRFRAYYTAHLVDHSQLYPGTREVLEYFKTRRQAVITNKPTPYAREILRALGVIGYFCEIVGGDSAYPKKPHPGALLGLMRNEGVSAEDTVFVGDSPIDVEAGRQAGVCSVSVSHGFSDEPELRAAAPEAMVGDFHDLLRLARAQRW